MKLTRLSSVHVKMAKSTFLLVLLAFCWLSLIVNVSYAKTFEDDTRLTKKEAAALRKFKTQVSPKLKHDYQKEDLFLLRHLRFYNFEIGKAEEYLMKNVKWREANDMENIHSKDWSDMEREYPMRVEGNDRAGRPMVIWELGDWDIRKAALAGKMERLILWTNKNWDMARIKVRELELQNKNVTRFTMVLDLRNINAQTNVNPTALPWYLQASLAYDGHFPQWGDNIWLLNSPGIFETVLALVRPVLSKETNDFLRVYPKNPDLWQPILKEHVDFKQLPQRYGGLKEDPH